MKVNTSHLEPGSILLNDIIGKSNRPIMLKGTEITDQHIGILHKFLIDTVEIERRGVFNGKSNDSKQLKVEETKKELNQDNNFMKEYNKAVAAYKEQYLQWQQSMPISIPNVRNIIVPLLEHLDQLTPSIIFSLHRYTRPKEYFFHHSIAVSLIAAFIAKQMGYRSGEWIQVGLAGMLSDCGMVKVDNSVIQKKGALTTQEFKKIEKHPLASYQMIKDSSLLTNGVKLAVLQHHERGNGEGYPLGMTFNKIHPYARIIAVADSYHAMATTTYYRKAKSLLKVIEELHVSVYRLYDKDVVSAFIDIFVDWLKNSEVILNNGISGEVVFINKNEPTRPIVRSPEIDKVFSLEQLPELYIEAVRG